MKASTRIPIPLRRRVWELRVQTLPLLVFTTSLLALAALWKEHVAPPTVVGRAESLLVQVRSDTTGVIARLGVTRLQNVKVGDVLAHLKPGNPTNSNELLAVSTAGPVAETASTIPITSDVEGTVMDVCYGPGEAVLAGQPLLTIRTSNAAEIVTYMRTPIAPEPKVGMPVEVRAHGARQPAGRAEIVEIGTQMVEVPAGFPKPTGADMAERGLRVRISLPSNLRVTSGEFVDISFRSGRN